MAVNQFYCETFQNLPGVTMIHVRATGAGAANMTGIKGNGLSTTVPIVRTGVGLHTVTLNRKFAGLLNVVANVIDVTSPDDWEVNLTTDLTNNQTFGIGISKAGVAAELSTDEKLLMTIILEDSATKPAGF